MAMQGPLLLGKPDAPEAPEPAEEVPVHVPRGEVREDLAPLEAEAVGNQALLILMMASLAAFVLVASGGAAARKSRGESFWVPKSDRPLPSLTMLDLLVVLVFFVALLPYAYAATLALTPTEWWMGQGLRRVPSGAAGRLALMVQTFLMYIAAVAGAVALARKRGGPSGAAGLWPFWSHGEEGTPRRLAGDAVYALGMLFVCVWIPMAANIVSHMVVTEWFGTPDENPVVTFMREELRERPGDAAVLVYAILGAAVLAPVFEELIFRGIVFNVMRRYLGVAGGAVVASALFALAHGVWSDFAALFVLGMLMTWIYERRGNLWSAMVVHATNNLIFVLVLFNHHDAL